MGVKYTSAKEAAGALIMFAQLAAVLATAGDASFITCFKPSAVCSLGTIGKPYLRNQEPFKEAHESVEFFRNTQCIGSDS